MPRQARLDAPGTLHYVILRGIEKRRIKGYRKCVKKGIDKRRRPELVGGGLIRSYDGWSTVKAMCRSEIEN